MITFKVKRSGLDIHAFAENLDGRLIQPLTEHLADMAEQLMREKAPVRTGMLKASIRKEVRIGEAAVGTAVRYALFVEAGTKPHEIHPIHARALRFEFMGRIAFAARVSHPGTRPQWFIRETANQVVQELPDLYEQVFKEAIKNGVV